MGHCGCTLASANTVARPLIIVYGECPYGASAKGGKRGDIDACAAGASTDVAAAAVCPSVEPPERAVAVVDGELMALCDCGCSSPSTQSACSRHTSSPAGGEVVLAVDEASEAGMPRGAGATLVIEVSVTVLDAYRALVDVTTPLVQVEREVTVCGL